MHVSTQFSLQPHDLCYDFCPIRSQLAEHEQEINDLEFKMEKVSHSGCILIGPTAFDRITDVTVH